MSNNRDQWGSSMGFVLAAAGSAVGLGNLWKFPYITWDNNGGAFVIVYLFCIALIGFPIMLSEILIGRRAQASPVPALEKLSAGVPGGGRWAIVGWIGVIAGVVILSFYSVIAGWSISSFLQCMEWSFTGYEKPGPDSFTNFLGNAPLQLGLTLVFSIMTAVIVMKGVSKGIEKATKILMPVLFGLMVLLVINSFFLDGFGEALSFLFTPDFSKLTDHSVLEALGHAFFTLSLGMGAMITYGSYMRKSESIKKAAMAIVILDTVIALMACIIMYSIIFSVAEIRDSVGKSTVGMLFVTLPNMFYTKMAGGVILAPMFYILVAFAALSSTMSLLEVVVSLLVDKIKVSRVKATCMAASGIFVFSIFCALSNGASGWFSSFKFFGQAESGIFFELNSIFFGNKAGFLNLFDHFSANWLLPVGGLLITIYTGWILNQKVSWEELEFMHADGKPTKSFYVFQFIMRFLAPVAIAWIIFKVIGGTDFS